MMLHSFNNWTTYTHLSHPKVHDGNHSDMMINGMKTLTCRQWIPDSTTVTLSSRKRINGTQWRSQQRSLRLPNIFTLSTTVCFVLPHWIQNYMIRGQDKIQYYTRLRSGFQNTNLHYVRALLKCNHWYTAMYIQCTSTLLHMLNKITSKDSSAFTLNTSRAMHSDGIVSPPLTAAGKLLFFPHKCRTVIPNTLCSVTKWRSHPKCTWTKLWGKTLGTLPDEGNLCI